MKKKIIYYGLSMLLAVGSPLALTGCIDETEPTSGVTKDQATSSPAATEGMLMGIPAYMLKYFSSSRHWSFNYPAIMHIRDVELQDMATTDQAMYYQWYAFSENIYMGQDYVFSQFLWNTQTKMASNCNDVIAIIDEENASDEQLGYLGAALAFRAFVYLDMAREYEFLPNDKTSSVNANGNDVSGLTVPIVKEGMTEAEARNNPRATREEMSEFILGDLQKAEQYISNLTLSTKILPHLDCVYGLYARYYMWLEDYVNAEKYARMAIDATSTDPMTETESLDTSTGFNDISKWMWGMQYTSESINNNLMNWIAHMSNETTFGYAYGGGCNVMIDANMYSRIGDSDWRKLLWKAPASSSLSGKNTYVDASIGSALADYSSLKFRPAQGETSDYRTACATAVPLMRVEEMYFIEAEAAAHQDASRGAQLLTSFMTTYRNPSYRCNVSSTDDVVEEIVFQKRIELWGEGQAFFDVKRLNYAVTRGYSGTNHLSNETFNTTTRPAWMNWVIVVREGEGNTAVKDWNNPDPTDVYDPWVE